MRVLITGATGFIGTYVLHEVIRRGHDVVALIHNSPPPADWNKVGHLAFRHFELGGSEKLELVGCGINAIVHLAAALSGTAECKRRSIIEGTRQLIEAAKLANVNTFVGISSISVIDYVSIPSMSVVNEDFKTLNSTKNNYSYAALKSEQESIMETFCTNNASQLTILRPGLVYDAEEITSAHAGIVKGEFGLLASHNGQVPLISATNLATAIVDSVELNGTGTEILHLVDDNLPTQAEYINELRNRKKLPANELIIPWRIFALWAVLCNFIFKIIGLENKVPEIFTKAGSAARLKPFKFSNNKAKIALKRPFKSSYKKRTT